MSSPNKTEIEEERDELASLLLRLGDLQLYNAVDDFSFEMKAKLGRKFCEGKEGWSAEDDPTWCVKHIRDRLIEHCHKGDPIDVANFALFLWYHERRRAKAEVRP